MGIKEDRMQILDMLKNGSISSEEAEKLLEALDESEEKRKKHQQRGRAGHTHGSHFNNAHGADFGFGGFMMGLGEFFESFDDWGKQFEKKFSKFGGMQGPWVGRMARNFCCGPHFSFNDFDKEGAQKIEAPFDEIDESLDYKFMVRPAQHLDGDFDISIQTDDHLTIESEEGTEVYLKGKTVCIIYHDAVSLGIPANCVKINLLLPSGDIKIDRLNCKIHAITLNGDIEINALKSDSLFHTLDGDISCSLTSDFSGKLKVSTLHGDLEATVPVAVNGLAKARTLNGEIEVNGELIEKQWLGKIQAVDTIINEGGDSNTLSLHTLNGDITLQCNGNISVKTNRKSRSTQDSEEYNADAQ
jgi:DUF4097 and DUF4098 domain-containing protein YvlB